MHPYMKANNEKRNDFAPIVNRSSGLIQVARQADMIPSLVAIPLFWIPLKFNISNTLGDVVLYELAIFFEGKQFSRTTYSLILFFKKTFTLSGNLLKISVCYIVNQRSTPDYV